MADFTHGVVNTTRCTCWDVDAYKLVGIAEDDMDNGTLVVLGDIAKTEGGNSISGYQFAVTAAQANSTGVCLVRTPEVGTTLGMNILNDPRAFYNEAGRPMSLCRLNPGVDYIEVNANCFVGGTFPQAGQQFVTIGAGGKMAGAAQAPDAGCYFTIVGEHFMDMGQTITPTLMLFCARN